MSETTDWIHDALDGKLSRAELTEDERRELEGLEAVVRESLAFARNAPVPNVERAVLDRIRELDVRDTAARRREAAVTDLADGLLAWLWRPRSVRLRPAWGLAAALVLALGIGLLPIRTGQPDGAGAELTSGSTAESVLYVRFELEASEASSVRVAGTFTDWQPSYELAETAPGRWTALVPIEPGVHQYAFVVDGERWVADPRAPRVSDGFGGVNSRIAVLASRDGRSGGSS